MLELRSRHISSICGAIQQVSAAGSQGSAWVSACFALPSPNPGLIVGHTGGLGGSHSMYTSPEGLVSNSWQSLGLIYISFGHTSPP